MLVLLAQPAPAQQTAPATAGPPTAASLADLLSQLPDADFTAKRDLVSALAAEGSPAALDSLSALLAGRLSYRLADKKVVVTTGEGETLTLTDAATGQALGTAPATDVDAIGTNNGLRRALRGAIAQIQLSSDDVAVRRAAVDELSRNLDDDAAQLLRDRLAAEKDAAVREAIASALAITDLGSGDATVRAAAIESLRDSLNNEVFARLTAMAGRGEDATQADPDESVRSAATTAVIHMQRWRGFYSSIETLLFGLSLGSVLVLAGIGLAVTFGVMGVINMAHGELMMLGAYTVYVVQQLMPGQIGASILVAIPVAFLVSGLFGVLIERGIVRHLYGRPLETLLATFGVSLVLQQLVRDVFSPNNRPVETPEWMAGSLQINDVLAITYSRLYIILFTLAVFALLLAVLRRTRLGLHVRAVSQNRSMAQAMGIRTEWVDALTFGLGSGIAGVAGVALSQLTNVGPNLGQSYIVDSFMVVVFGGVGSLWGTLTAGTSLGVVSKLLEPAVGAVLAKILVLVFLIVFIQRRPRGLFPQKGRAAEG
ncbi:MAG: urea ABC transporter permease subunit UrtB [Proteobacteria bacterium]|nr:MAG: urea ABC transporter permease subunit UrtB [Pseudomonadota bacterium]